MFRTVLQWLISRKVDDGTPLGSLSWLIRYDKELLSYYENLLRLESRLQHDASALLEHAAQTHRKPLRIVSRSLRYSEGKLLLRLRCRKALSVIGLTILFVFGAGLFFSAPFALFDKGEKTVVAGQSSELRQPITAPMYSDPQIYTELLQLCQQLPNESGPFFVNPER